MALTEKQKQAWRERAKEPAFSPAGEEYDPEKDAHVLVIPAKPEKTESET